MDRIEEIKARLVEKLGEQFGEAVAEAAAADGVIFTPHSGGPVPRNDDALDSLDRVEFVMSIEDEFNISIDDVFLPGFRTVNDIASFVETMTRGPANGGN